MPDAQRDFEDLNVDATGTAGIRADLRSSWSPRYSGFLHAAFTFGFGGAVLVYAISRVHQPTWQQLCVVPLTFLYANLVEWRAHKGPMHHKTRGLALIHQRHTLEHHRFFTEREMHLQSHRDIKMVLFPPYLIFFFALFAAPVAFLFAHFLNNNIAQLFIATAIGYFLLYETLHLTYHLPPGHWIPRLPILRTLRHHHALHHNPARMTDGNFNVTFPISDALFRTFIREER